MLWATKCPSYCKKDVPVLESVCFSAPWHILVPHRHWVFLTWGCLRRAGHCEEDWRKPAGPAMGVRCRQQPSLSPFWILQGSSLAVKWLGLLEEEEKHPCFSTGCWVNSRKWETCQGWGNPEMSMLIAAGGFSLGTSDTHSLGLGCFSGTQLKEWGPSLSMTRNSESGYRDSLERR